MPYVCGGEPSGALPLRHDCTCAPCMWGMNRIRMVRNMPQDLRILPKLRDSLSYLYFDKAIIERDNNAIVVLRKGERIPVPIASLTVLMLGPGTNITHAAMKVIAENGCMVVWCGEGAERFYGYGMGETRSSERLMRQAKCFADDTLHMQVVRRMYSLRFEGISTEDMTLQQIRGMEGVRVREFYKLFAKKYRVRWNGRNYKEDEWDASDDLNRALSAANACLYGLCNAAIVSLGYSPGLGFVHTGKMMSFVYDVADLYKAETTIPAAFEAVSQPRTDGIEVAVRKLCRTKLREKRVLKRIADDLAFIFQEEAEDDPNQKRPCLLWDEDSEVQGGVNYAEG